MPVGLSLARSLLMSLWLGFVVVGIYNPTKIDSDDIEYKGDFQKN